LGSVPSYFAFKTVNLYFEEVSHKTREGKELQQEFKATALVQKSLGLAKRCKPQASSVSSLSF
jgi:hypothetical protein